MNVDITARHAPVTKQVKEHVRDRLDQALRHADGLTSVHVILDAARGRHSAEFIVHGRDLAATVSATDTDVWVAVDMAAEKLRHQLEHVLGKKREKRRRSDGIGKAEAELAARAALVPAIEEESQVRIVRTRPRKVKPMALDDARLELEERNAEFLVFRDAKSERVQVLYRRRDGDLGLVDTGAD